MLHTRLFFMLLMLAFACCKAQIGISSGKFMGAGAGTLKASHYFQVSAFIPSIQFKLKTGKNVHVRMALRPSFKWMWYNFKNNLVVSRDSNFTSFIPDPNPDHVYSRRFLKKSSMMRASSFFVPLTFPFISKKLKYFVFSPGIWAEYILGGKFSRKYTDRGTPVSLGTKFKDGEGFYGLRRFQFGLCGSIQYKFFTVYSSYSLVPLFLKDQGPDIRKFETGILLNFFWKKSPFYKIFSQ